MFCTFMNYVLPNIPNTSCLFYANILERYLLFKYAKDVYIHILAFETSGSQKEILVCTSYEMMKKIVQEE